MRKKWLVPGSVILALVSLSGLARWWLPWLLELAGSHANEIQGLTGIVQMVLWIGAAVVALVKLRPFSQGPKPDLTPDPSPIALPSPGRGAPPFSRDNARIYLDYLVDAYQYLDLRGMGVTDRVALKLPLLEMYVPLKARLSMPEGEAWARDVRVAGRAPGAEEKEGMGERVSKPVPVLDLLRDHDGLVLLGDPGSGKTTFLKLLTVALAAGKGEALGLGDRLPILLPPSGAGSAGAPPALCSFKVNSVNQLSCSGSRSWVRPARCSSRASSASRLSRSPDEEPANARSSSRSSSV